MKKLTCTSIVAPKLARTRILPTLVIAISLFAIVLSASADRPPREVGAVYAMTNAALTPGKERTEAEFAPAALSIIEAVVADGA